MYRSRKVTRNYKPHKAKKRLVKPGAECPFCNLPKNQVLHDGKLMQVIDNKFPYQYWEFVDVTDHIMVIPKRHIKSLADMTPAEQAEAMKIFIEYQKKDYNIYTRSNINPMKSVPHQHTHLIKVEGKIAKFAGFLNRPYFVWKV